jgi:hypothetical protein
MVVERSQKMRCFRVCVDSSREFRRAARASPLPGATLPGLAERKTFRNSRGHGLATVVPWSVSAFLLGKTSVGPPLLQRGQRLPHAEYEVPPRDPPP